MLTRRAARETPGDIDISRFVNDRGDAPGTGECSWFFEHGHAGHLTRAAAVEQWSRCRREGWSTVYLFHLPAAARYDGLSKESWPLAWSAGQSAGAVDAGPILRALRRDRAAVATFSSRDPVGADSIHDYLRQWVRCLDTIEDVARQLADAAMMIRTT